MMRSYVTQERRGSHPRGEVQPPSAQGHRVGPHRALLLLHRLDRTRLVGVDHLTGLAFALLERDPAKTTLEQRANRLDVAARAHQFLLTGAPPIQVADCRSVL